MTKLKVIAEGRADIYIPEKESLKAFIEARNLERIHNFIPSGAMMIGADYEVKSVLSDIDNAERLAIFTNPNENMGHSLAIIRNNKLQCYDIGNITVEELSLS